MEGLDVELLAQGILRALAQLLDLERPNLVSQRLAMFALKGRLLEGALLSGTWELAVLPPVPGGEVPLAVGALHHRAAAPLAQALDEATGFLDQQQARREVPAAADENTEEEPVG